jgi:chorismate mutase/prephenate dehydrogenase
VNNSRIEQLRQKLDSIDEQIIQLLAERQMNVDAIGREKLVTKKATRDFEREKKLLTRARALAEQHGLEPELINELFSLIIRASLQKQEKQKVASSTLGSNKTALVIGGNGAMGRWFVRFLQSQGFAVQISDPQTSDNAAENIGDFRQHELPHDFIVVAAPLAASAKILLDLAKIRPAGIIMDVGSIKSPLKRPLRQLADAGCRVVSIHPMFGPDARLLSGKHVIFIDVDGRDSLAQAQALFEPTMATRIQMKLEDHDRLIAYVLGLSHALNLAFLTVLAESGEAAETLAQLSSTTFDAQLHIASKVAQENPYLYFEIQKLNHYNLSTLHALNDTVARLIDLIQNNQADAFADLMRNARAWAENQHNTQSAE